MTKGYCCLIATLLSLGSSPAALAKAWSDLPDNNLNLKFGIATPNFQMDMKPNKEDTGTALEYRPNVRSSLFVGASYWILGGSVGITTPADEEQTLLKGDTDLLDFQFRFYRPKFTYEFYFQEYKGYFIENSEDVDSSLGAEDPRIQLPEFTSKHYGSLLTYRFQPDDYSMAAAFDQGAWQNKWGGSWLLLASLSYYELANKGGLIPSTMATSFGEMALIEKAKFINLGLAVGYGYNINYAGYYLTGLFMLGPGTQHQTYENTNGTSESRWDSATKGSLRAGLGYNGKKFFSGFNLLTDSSSLNLSNGQVAITTLDISLFLGFHIH